MEEDAVEPRGPRADQTEWRRQIAENNYVRRGQQECDSNDRHGDEDQGEGTAECERICEVYAIQE
eukprot:5942621-Heterocapsa_arctica.AAC.1